MGPHGILGDEEFAADLPVGLAPADHGQDFPLPPGQGIEVFLPLPAEGPLFQQALHGDGGNLQLLAVNRGRQWVLHRGVFTSGPVKRSKAAPGQPAARAADQATKSLWFRQLLTIDYAVNVVPVPYAFGRTPPN